MRDVAVIGVGMHPFGKFDKSYLAMCRETVEASLQDAGVEWGDIQAIAAGSSRFSGGLGWGLTGNDITGALGQTGIPTFNLSSACATGANAFSVGHMLVASGMYDIVLVVAGEKMPKGFIPRPPGAADDPSDVDYLRWACVGLPNTGYWALETLRRMEEFGTTERHLAMVSAKAHKVGANNPNARYKDAFTIEDVLNSPMVSYPLRLYEICAVSDGAAAAIICSAEEARKRITHPIWVKAATVGTAQFGDRQIRIPELAATAKPIAAHVSEVTSAVRKAFEIAEIEPRDVDLVELQDNSVWQEIAFPELWGLCEPGESDWLIEHGETGVDGKLPLNPSGGFLSFGEATTAMGVFQVYEIVSQLRGEAGRRQVPNARVGLGQTLGLGGNGSAVLLSR